LLGKTGYKDIPLPASYFFAYDFFSPRHVKQLIKTGHVYVKHDWASSWSLAPEQILEVQQKNKELKNSLAVLKERKRNIQYIAIFGSVISLCLGFFLGLKFRKSARKAIKL